ncbi:MAG TPA: sigma 54-interacting transcriptional regulator, partial [Thermoanaerobaculia bacterium]|nr:sigma 54-interacting transcriptional regulator [Thermoanaerobaculia bacterium]
MSGAFQHGLVKLSPQGATTASLARAALLEALEITGGESGGLALFDLLSPGFDALAFASQGWSPETSDTVVGGWRRELPLGGAKDHAQSRHVAQPVPYGSSNCSAVAEFLCEGDRIAGILQVESSVPCRLRKEERERLGSLGSALVARVHRMVLLERLEEGGHRCTLLGESEAFLQLERRLRSASAHGSGAVLIRGERGSGKELAARSVHFWSESWREPFVPVLASAFAPELFASELFGHEKSSFSGADRARTGKLLAADGGTVFLDEVADWPPAVQAAVLRLVEYGEVHRIGRDLPLAAHVRLIAATNRDLDRLVQSGRFRADLYDRLRVIEVHVPPLRERRGDIEPFARYFLRKHCRSFRRERAFASTELCTRCGAHQVGCATRDFFEALEGYDWPGNVREL